VDGFIIPDLPLEEAQDIETACRQQGLALIYLAPPNAAPGRLSLLAERTSGFLYLVSVKGVTGARSAFSSDLGDFVERARAVAHTPVAVGFGIATPEQAAAVGQMAQGVIVGSALINTMDANPEAPVQAVKKYVASLIQGMKN
jgi:tryptophan synthase alpha chain